MPEDATSQLRSAHYATQHHADTVGHGRADDTLQAREAQKRAAEDEQAGVREQGVEGVIEGVPHGTDD